jgi:hypothetical protein
MNPCSQCFDLLFLDDGHKFEDNVIEASFAAKLLALGGVLVVHDAWPPGGRARLALEAVQATVAFITANFRFLEPLPARVPGFAAFVKRFPDNRQWDHFISFEWKNGAEPQRRYWNRRPSYSNPACQNARNVKPFKWCKGHVLTEKDCESVWMRERCNATCNGC